MGDESARPDLFTRKAKPIGIVPIIEVSGGPSNIDHHSRQKDYPLVSSIQVAGPLLKRLTKSLVISHHLLLSGGAPPRLKSIKILNETQ